MTELIILALGIWLLALYLLFRRVNRIRVDLETTERIQSNLMRRLRDIELGDGNE